MSSARWWRRYFLRRQEKNKPRIIFGIDPGSIVCGYGIIKTVQSPGSIPRHIGINSNTDTVYVASGRIMLPSKQPLNVRLKELYSNLTDIIREYSPHEVAIEKVFFAKSIKAALVLGQARGAALVAAASSGLPVYEYSALEVKKAVVGYGRAEYDFKNTESENQTVCGQRRCACACIVPSKYNENLKVRCKITAIQKAGL